MHGRTPNPCIACNRYVKWEALLQRSLAIGADYIATGHYARIEQLAKWKICDPYILLQLQKDQTYALYNLTQNQLAQYTDAGRRLCRSRRSGRSQRALDCLVASISLTVRISALYRMETTLRYIEENSRCRNSGTVIL